MSSRLKEQMLTALEDIDRHAQALAEANGRFISARDAYVRSTAGRELKSGEVLHAPDTSIAAGLSPTAFYTALGRRLASLGLRGLMSPDVARSVKPGKGEGFIDAWRARVERCVR